jgi:DinB superfamily
MSYDGPDAIAPDTKNWTWVLERPCPQCGLDTRTVEPIEVAGRLDRLATAFAEVLRGGDVTTRPEPGVWSPLEYGCHVRDVFRVFGERIRQMLEEDDPLFADWDQDATAVEGRYAEQDPAVVATELREAGDALVARLDGVAGEQWLRPGRRTDGSVFTVASLSLYLLHDPVHHYYDVTGVTAA